MRDAVIYDLDGTLCDTSSIQHLIEGEDRDFAAFHAASADCPPRDEVLAAARADHEVGLAVLVVSSREFIWRDLSLDWLARHEIAYDGLYLRVVGDYRKDVAIKNETWDHLVDDGFVVIGAWDDKQAVLDVWAERGVADLHLVSDC
jgi:phosphoglycolate phosphatase-like HAD superfamily hydrolase